MGTTAEKLTYLNNTKQLLKENINSLGGNLTTEPFRQYASVLEGIYERIPKVSGIGSNLNLSPTMVGRIKLNEIDGDTLQDGTPTPSSPVEIQNVTGLQNINVCGKNLLNNVATTQEINDITFTRNSDGSFNVNGTASAIATLNLIDKNFILPAGQYTLSGCPTGGGTNTWRIDINNGAVLAQRDEGNGATFTLSQDLEVFNVRIRIANGVNVNNLTFKPMLEVGNQKTTYEPYAGNTYEVNLGKNLFGGFTYTNIDYVGISFTYNNNGTILIDGTNNSGTTAYSMTTSVSTPYQITLLPGIYTISGGLSNAILQVINSSGSLVSETTSSVFNTTFTLTQQTKIYVRVRVANGISFSNQTINIMLEKGSQATSYSPYFTPIELNNEDSIKKSTGKNLFDKNNINEIRGTINVDSGIFTYSSTSMNYCFYMPCKSNTTYTIQKRNDGDTNRFKFASCSTEISTQESAVTNLTSKTSDDSASSLTITTGPNDIYIMAQYYRSAETKLTKQQILDSIMIEENNQATNYEPYLPKGTWYVEKNTRKLELAIADMNNSENYPGWKNQTQLKQDYPNVNDSAFNIGMKYYSNICEQPNEANDYIGINSTGTSSIFLRRSKFGTDHTQTYWETNYPNLVFTIIYNLLTPEITNEITNTTLINQLEALYSAKSKEGTTNIVVTSENLSMIINASALKGDVE